MNIYIYIYLCIRKDALARREENGAKLNREHGEGVKNPVANERRRHLWSQSHKSGQKGAGNEEEMTGEGGGRARVGKMERIRRAGTSYTLVGSGKH